MKYQKVLLSVVLLLSAALLGGCSRPQLEERAFPLALAVAPADRQGMYEFTFFFEDTALADAAMYHKENCCVTGTDYADAYDFFAGAQAAEPDDRHMQAVILSGRLLSDEDFLTEFVAYAVNAHHFSWNTRVYVLDEPMDEGAEKAPDIADMQALAESAGDHVGTYLSDVAQNLKRQGAGSVPTIGALYQELYNREGGVNLPLLQSGSALYVKGWQEFPEDALRQKK